MSSIGQWTPDKGLPNTLEGMLKETEINNTFKNSIVTEQLKESMESSYAYLYRHQQLASHYTRINYKTRDFLVNTTYSEKQDTIHDQSIILHELEKDPVKNADEIKKVKDIITKYTEIKYGDLYLDKKTKRVCCDVDYDIIMPDSRDRYVHSRFFGKELNLFDILQDKLTFIEAPILIFDGKLHTDISFKIHDKSMTFYLNSVSRYEIYRRNNGTQYPHEFCFMFFENSYIGEMKTKLSSTDVNENGIKFYLSDLSNQKDLKDCLDTYKGSFICTYRYPYVKENINKVRVGSFMYLTYDPNTKLAHADIDELSKKNLKLNDGAEITISVIFIRNFFRYESQNFDDNIITRVRKNMSTNDNGVDIYGQEYVSPILIPTRDIEGTDFYNMPIPDSNTFVLCEDTEEGVSTFRPHNNLVSDIHYPNFHIIDDPDAENNSRYKMFYFYADDAEKEFTNLFLFFTDFVKRKSKFNLEKAINNIYTRFDDSGNVSSEDPTIYHFLNKILSYKDYEYFYGTPDFENYYTGDPIPVQYKAARMREFVRADWNILKDYVKAEKFNNTIYHFFVNTINLLGRRRRSTRFEFNTEPYLFADKLTRSTKGQPNTYRVSDSLDYDFITEIYIDDAKIKIPDITAGEYVQAENLVDRYVFAFKNDDPIRNIPLHIFVDGLRIGDVEIVHKLGMDYVYIPMKDVKEDSYIMVERDYYLRKPIKVKIDALYRVPTSVHFMETEGLSYTMNDIYLEDIEGNIVPKDNYIMKLERNHVSYDMSDERHKVVNKYGYVTDVEITFTNISTIRGGTVYVCVDKTAHESDFIVKSTFYPRFYLDGFSSVDELGFVRMFFKGRKVDNELFKLINCNGTLAVQSRVEAQKGDCYVFEIAPYTRDLVYELDTIPDNYMIDLTGIIDKPLDPEYYEIYVNGRRLGLPNVFEFGPHHAVFKGLHSKNKLQIFERERDFEYFGYEQINMDSSKDTYEYYFVPFDLYNSSDLSEQDKKDLVDAYIDQIKHPKAQIKENDTSDDDTSYDFNFNILEDISIFYYDDLLPLGLANPDEVQFNKEYLTKVYPDLSGKFCETINNADVIFLNPDDASRSFRDGALFSDIEVDKMDEETTEVYLMGENGINKYSD